MTNRIKCVNIYISSKKVVFIWGEDMNRFEKEEINTLPNEYRPMGAWGYFWHSVLFLIPIIGWIALLICAFNSYSIPCRSFARSYFVAFFLISSILLVAEIVILVISWEQVVSIFEQVKAFILELFDTYIGNLFK